MPTSDIGTLWLIGLSILLYVLLEGVEKQRQGHPGTKDPHGPIFNEGIFSDYLRSGEPEMHVHDPTDPMGRQHDIADQSFIAHLNESQASVEFANGVFEMTKQPPDLDSHVCYFETSSLRKHILNFINGFRRRAASLFVLAISILALETALIFLSVSPLFQGINDMSYFLLPGLALAFTATMVYLSYKGRVSKGNNKYYLCLAFFAACTAALRARILFVDSATISIEAYALCGMMFLSALLLPLAVDKLFHSGMKDLSRAAAAQYKRHRTLAALEGQAHPFCQR